MIEMTVLSEEVDQEGLTLVLGANQAFMRYRKEGEGPDDFIYIEVPIPYDQLLEGACTLKSNKPCALGDEKKLANFIPYGNFQYLLSMSSPGCIGANIFGLKVGFDKQVLETLAQYALTQLS